VAIVGIDPSGNHVWVNPTNSQVLPMSSSYNTVTGPTYGGNTGPGLNSKYAACFFRLSAIPNKTFTLPSIAGCRVYISRGQQLYFYFFGASGAPNGYAGPNLQNSTNPNQNIVFETIELTNNQYGFFGNTTRVDAFQYPMGLELYGNGGYYKKTGELKTAADIVSAYKANVPTEFQSTVNSTTGVITFPSKSPAFADGTNGTTAGAQANYFKSYIDAIWNKYKSVDLIFNAGNAGVFKGRVDANDRLVVVGQSGAYQGRTGIINGRPTTQMAFEGKGLLDNRVSDGDCDLVVQAQLTAAINRHVVNTTSATPGQQDFYNVGSFYQAAPMNYYARFWHLPGISVDNLSYGFAYDDVADQSATLQTPQPTRVVATWGGFAGQTGGSTGTGVATFYKDCNYTGTAVSLPAGTYTLSQLQAKGIANDDVSSLQVNSGYSVVLYENDSFSGAALTVTGSNSCLVNNALGTGNWNDKTTSLKIQAATAAFSKQLEAETANVNSGMTAEACADTGGGQDMGYVDAGDYLVFNGITFPSTGTYLIEYRVASPSGGTISSDLNAGNIQFGNTTIPATGGWQSWTTVSKTVTVTAGTYNFGVFAQTGGYNINWMRISSASGARTTAAAALATAPDAAQLSLYPNPTAGQLTLEVAPALEGAAFRIVNALGQSVRTGQLRNGSLDVSSLPGGLYLLAVPAQADQPALTRRFTKE